MWRKVGMEILKRYFLILMVSIACVETCAAKIGQNPVTGLAERVCPGSSKHFSFELEDETSATDFFTLESKGSRIRIAGNNWISVATGFNWYLKYYANANITWGNMKQTIARFPKVAKPVRHETQCLVRYCFSYNTFTYSTPFWDWKRWQEEIDFMALHGINTPLALTGSQAVWMSTLMKSGYSREEASAFVGDATHQAQVLHGVMEGGAEKLTDDWFASQVELARKILSEYEKWGMEPVLPGFSGTVPHDFGKKTGAKTYDMGSWGGYCRPSVLDPSDPQFAKIAQIYYGELHRLLGDAHYYSMDPLFGEKLPEGLSASGIGHAVWQCMDAASEGSVWVTSAWRGHPGIEMIDGIAAGRLLVLDSESDSRPMWGDHDSPYFSEDGFLYHDWLYCQKLDYGGRPGMYGRMQRLINGYFSARKEGHLAGVGGTMDAVGSNPAMWELLYELPWRKGTFLAYDWVKQYVHARYGHTSENLLKAWDLILETLYSADGASQQDGPSESVFCARPALSVPNVSKTGTTARYYDTGKVRQALELLLTESERMKYSDNYNCDIIELAATVNSDYAAELLSELEDDFEKADTAEFGIKSDEFLNLISLQNTLMNCRRETMVGDWIEHAMAQGTGIDESEIMRKDARRLITTWGSHECANIAGMHEYAYRQWGGLLRDYYYERWRSFFSYIRKNHTLPVGYDFFEMENDWVEAVNPYSFTPVSGSAAVARHILNHTKI